MVMWRPSQFGLLVHGRHLSAIFCEFFQQALADVGMAISRPRKRTVTFTRLPSDRKRWALRTLTLKSLTSIPGDIRTSLISTIRWFFFASLSRLVCSKRYLP